jgi:hypothetical protein
MLYEGSRFRMADVDDPYGDPGWKYLCPNLKTFFHHVDGEGDQIPKIFAFAAANSSSLSAPESCSWASFWICAVASSSTGAGAL